MAVQRTLAIIKTVIFTVLVPGFVAVIVPAWLRTGSSPFSAVLAIMGAVRILAGVLIYLRCAWDFAHTGLGTPATIDPPRVLVLRGLHRFMRNPMYVGVLLVILGKAALFDSRQVLLYGGCFFLMVHLFVIFYEEPTLAKNFGASCDQYRRDFRAGSRDFLRCGGMEAMNAARIANPCCLC
jgi:protein-S-isoprenylcysteine O-methyltransferase Ste14